VTFLLVFRVNTGYERWWEGRRTFRDVVNHCRDLARQVTTLVADWYVAEKMVRWIIAYIYLLKRHVREDEFVDELRGIVSDDALNLLDSSRNKPLVAAQRISELVYSALASHSLFPDCAPSIDINISDMVNCIGTCEMCDSPPACLCVLLDSENPLLGTSGAAIAGNTEKHATREGKSYTRTLNKCCDASIFQCKSLQTTVFRKGTIKELSIVERSQIRRECDIGS
jgi:hypothetical protein